MSRHDKQLKEAKNHVRELQCQLDMLEQERQEIECRLDDAWEVVNTLEEEAENELA